MKTLEDRFGLLACGLLSDRRGSRVWKITTGSGAMALKANDLDCENARLKALELEQENRCLLRLGEAGAIDQGYRIDSGGSDDGHWLAVRWIDGVPLWRAFSVARGPEGDRPSVRPWLLGIARTWARRLARLHAVGWAHADVQPTNTLVTGRGATEIIDYALSCGPDLRGRLPYRGALTHTTAPEIAAAVLSTDDGTHIQAAPAADVWSLGASLFWCWTGHRPVLYEGDMERRDKLRAIADGNLLDLKAVRPWSFTEFERLITSCMHADSTARPTAAELAETC
ncbi:MULTISPECIES: protein kinase domain-containing protein [unclassified Streptomyces]|uniref:protein kinase domain-containing protein n=1 Tax=unclassified Streptomyces TaxID=2593676 RepID=UPI0033185CD3